jgi:transaldolase
MKIFIDSAKLEEIKHAYSYGIIDGVTTNPSLIKKAIDDLKQKYQNINMESYIKNILLVAKGTPVSLEVMGTSYQAMVREGKILYKLFNPIARNVYIKIPVSPALDTKSEYQMDGLKAIKELSKSTIPVNCTLIFTPEQALMAAKAGAAFVSPFVGRIDDYLRDKNAIQYKKEDYFPCTGYIKDKKLLEDNGIFSGVDLIQKCAEIFKRNNFKTKILAASIRNTRQLREVALAGADIVTLPFNVIKELIFHPKTIEGMNAFIKDSIVEYENILKSHFPPV